MITQESKNVMLAAILALNVIGCTICGLLGPGTQTGTTVQRLKPAGGYRAMIAQNTNIPATKNSPMMLIVDIFIVCRRKSGCKGMQSVRNQMKKGQGFSLIKGASFQEKY